MKNIGWKFIYCKIKSADFFKQLNIIYYRVLDKLKK